MERKKKITTAVIVVLILLPSIILVVGFCIFYAIYFWLLSPVPYDSYALLKNRVSGKLVERKVYKRGSRIWTGFANEFIFFPAFPQTVSWIGKCNSDGSNDETCRISGRDRSGLLVHLDIEYLYVIEGDHVLQLYDEYGVSNYQLYPSLAAEGLIVPALKLFNTSEFVDNRFFVKQTFKKIITDGYREITNKTLRIVDFFLLRIDLDDGFEKSLLDSLVADQREEKVQLTTKRDLIISNTLYQTSIITSRINTILQTNVGIINNINIEAETNSTVYKLMVEESVFNMTRNALNLTTGGNMLNYLFSKKLEKLKDKKFMILKNDQTVIIEN